MTKNHAIQLAKEFRRDADALLQRMKAHKVELAMAPWTDDLPQDRGEVIAQHIISIRDLESCIMRQGMVLKNIGGENPYPTSYDPSSSRVEPTADGLKL